MNDNVMKVIFVDEESRSLKESLFAFMLLVGGCLCMILGTMMREEIFCSLCHLLLYMVMLMINYLCCCSDCYHCYCYCYYDY